MPYAAMKKIVKAGMQPAPLDTDPAPTPHFTTWGLGTCTIPAQMVYAYSKAAEELQVKAAQGVGELCT